MILTKNVTVKWHSRNKNHYQSKGYIFTKMGDWFIVDIKDLTKGSHAEVEILCDYCEEIVFKLPYLKYYSNMNKDKVAKNACNKCRELKRVEGFDYSNRRPRGYWSVRENRLSELKQYMEKYKTLENIYGNQEGHNLITQFKNNGHDINDGLKEIDLYDTERKYKPRDYYTDLSNLVNIVEPIIDEYGRFPTYNEIVNETGMHLNALNTKESIAEVRKILRYNIHENMVDDSGFLNRSSYEFIVAQFLLGNKITYKREQLPFPSHESNCRSDFTIYPENESEIHVEVWGVDDGTSDNTIYENYHEKMKNKKILYKQYEVPVIDIYPNYFKGKYKEVQNKLIEVFRFVKSLDLKHVSQNKLIPCTQMTDRELLYEIMKYSDDGITLPSFNKLKEVRQNGLYISVMKRYDTWMDFASKFGKKTIAAPQNFWSKERIFDFFDSLIADYNYIPTKSEMNKYYKGLGYATDRFGVTNLKLEYFGKLLDKGVLIPIKEYKWLKMISEGKGTGHWRLTTNQQTMSRKLFSRAQKDSMYNKKIV